MDDASATLAPSRIRRRLEGEPARRLVHASGALVPLGYLALQRLDGVPMRWSYLQAFLVAGVVLAALLEWSRLSLGVEWPGFDHLTREYEHDQVAGYALYALSFAIVGLAARPRVALVAMLALSVGDPVGGVLSGDDPRPTKRPLAIAGTFLAVLPIGAILLPSLPVAVAAAGAAAIGDGVFLEVRERVIDDNLVIPLVTAAAAEVALLVGSG